MIDLAYQRIEDIASAAVARIKLQRVRAGLALNCLRDGYSCPQCSTGHLDVASALQRPEVGKGLRNIQPPRQQAVVAQNDGLLLANRRYYARTLIGVYRDAFECVVRQALLRIGQRLRPRR